MMRRGVGNIPYACCQRIVIVGLKGVAAQEKPQQGMTHFRAVAVSAKIAREGKGIGLLQPGIGMERRAFLPHPQHHLLCHILSLLGIGEETEGLAVGTLAKTGGGVEKQMFHDAGRQGMWIRSGGERVRRSGGKTRTIAGEHPKGLDGRDAI